MELRTTQTRFTEGSFHLRVNILHMFNHLNRDFPMYTISLNKIDFLLTNFMSFALCSIVASQAWLVNQNQLLVSWKPPRPSHFQHSFYIPYRFPSIIQHSQENPPQKGTLYLYLVLAKLRKAMPHGWQWTLALLASTAGDRCMI